MAENTLQTGDITVKKTALSQRFPILAEGSMGMSGEGMMSPDGKPKTDAKDDSGPASEPHKPKVPP